MSPNYTNTYGKRDQVGLYFQDQMSIGRLQEWLGRAVREPLTGIPILAAVLYATYLVVGVFGAQTLVAWLEDGLFGGVINPAAVAAASHIPVDFIRFPFWSAVMSFSFTRRNSPI